MSRRAPLASGPTTALALLAVAGCAPADRAVQEQPTTREYINGRSATDQNAAPFSGAVKVGNTLYISGSLGLGPGQEVPETAEEEARNVLSSIRSTVEAAGMTMDDLVQVHVFAADVADYDAFNSVYRTMFSQEYPARAFLGAGPLLFGARFEVMGIAIAR